MKPKTPKRSKEKKYTYYYRCFKNLKKKKFESQNDVNDALEDILKCNITIEGIKKATQSVIKQLIT